MIKVSDRQPHTLSVSAGTSWVFVGSFWVTHPVALEGDRKKHPADRETSPLQQQHKLQSTYLTVDRPVSVFGCRLLHPGGCVAPTNTDHHRSAREGRGKEVKGKKTARGAAKVWMKQPPLRAMMVPLAQPQTQALLLSQNKNPTCKQQEKKNQEWQNKQIKPHTRCPHTHARSRDRNIPDGTQSALKPDRHATETRLIQMISQLCCHIRE